MMAQTHHSSLRDLEQAAGDLAEALGLPAPRGASERDALCLAARRAMESPGLRGAQLRSEEWESQSQALGELLHAGSELARLHCEYGPRLVPGAWDQDVRDVRQVLAARERQWWRWLSPAYWRARHEAAGLARGRLQRIVGGRIELVDAVLEAQGQQALFEQHTPLGQRLLGPRWQGRESDWQALSALAAWVQALYGDIKAGRIPDGIIEYLEENPSTAHLERLVKAVEDAARVHAGIAGIIRTRLAESRRDLLDLGLRNPLLNYRLLRSRGLEVVDELPSHLYRILVEEGKAMSFLPLAEEAEDGLLGQPEEGEQPEEAPDQAAARHTDTALQTALTSQELQARLLSTYHLANSFIQEQGVNTLFLALGMLTWYESEGNREGRRAPLVLVPAQLERTSVRHRFCLRHTGEDPGVNLSLLEKARNDFSAALPGLPEAEDLDIDRYFNAVEVSIKDLPAWSLDRGSVVLGFFSFSKFLMYRDLDVDNWPGDAKPTEHPILGALLHDGFDEPAPLISGDDRLDERLPPAQVHHVVDADGSQTLAIVDVNSGRNLVVQGPPGTGKSQTITNMIAEAIGHGRTALFVSEKMAALEVVKRRLDNVGLGDACLELHSHKTTKRAVVDELKRTLELGQPRLGQIEADLEALGQLRQRLNAYCDAVNLPVGESGVSPYRAYGELILLQERHRDSPLPKLEVPSIQAWSDADFRRKEGVVGELQARLSSMGVPQEHSFWGCRRRVLLPTDRDAVQEALQTAQESLSAWLAEARGLANVMGLPMAATPSESQGLCLAARLSMEAPDLSGTDPRASEWRTARQELGELLSAGTELARLHQEYDQVLIEGAWQQDLLDVKTILEAKGRRLWRLLAGDYRQARNRLKALCRTRMPSGIDAQVRLADAVLESQRLQPIVRGHEPLGERLFGPRWRSEHPDWAALSSLAGWLQGVYDAIDAGRVPVGIIDFLAEKPAVGDLQPHIEAIETARGLHARKCGDVAETLDMDMARHFGSGPGLEDQPFDIQKETLDTWLARIDDIHQFLSFNQMAQTCRSEGLEPVVALAESWGQAGSRLVDALRRAWFESMLEKALQEREALAAFDGSSHREILQRFRGLDSLSLQHNRARLAHAHWDRLPRQEGGGQLGVLRRQFELRRRHLPIRQLMARAGNAVQAVKPVFMMSPLSVAAYIPPGSLTFDLVIFDEASQVKPVDAFGAILRAHQAVVVGDSQQLPPSNFFDAMAQGSGDEDESMTADIESVLGLFASQNAPGRMLRWHYRSKHESLIAVSNREFYNNALVVFPSPDVARQDLGLRFHHLPDTVYDRGGSRTNREEAEAVARAVMEHAQAHPGLTLGVAAFSSAQMGAIQDRLELLRRQDPSCEGFFAAHPHEPFFVKNLETVQGDERDVILISIGYGRDASGQMDMNFGPLNRDGGERRLNVLITRAKSRCEVFTNLTADDIDLRRTNARGVRALKTFLGFAQSGVLDIPAESQDEKQPPFEEAVASELAKMGLEVRRRVGSAGYFIDLAIVDPGHPGRYLLGIECDGATYHSSRSARDRDRLRQQVLEGLGWRIHRIWSTDWFRNPQRELKRVVDAIEGARASLASETAGAEHSPSLQRAGDDKGPPDEVPKYRVATPRGSAEGQDFSAVPVATVALLVAEVVEVESPVHVAEVARRIADSAGVRRGRRYQEAIDQAVEEAVASGRVRREGDFLWWADMEQPALRDRAGLPAASHNLEYVTPEEMALAVHKVVAGSYGIDRDEVPGRAARLMGFPRLTAEMRRAIEPVIGQLLREGRLAQQGSQLVAAREEDG